MHSKKKEGRHCEAMKMKFNKSLYFITYPCYSDGSAIKLSTHWLKFPWLTVNFQQWQFDSFPAGAVPVPSTQQVVQVLSVFHVVAVSLVHVAWRTRH